MVKMDKKGKKVFTSLAVLAGLASGAGALNMFVNRTVKAMLYRHHKEDDKPSILETKYGGKNVFIKNRQGIKLKLENIQIQMYYSLLRINL